MSFKFSALFVSIFFVALPHLVIFEKNPGEVNSSDFLILLFCFYAALSLLFFLYSYIAKKKLQALTSAIVVFIPFFIVNENTDIYLNILVWGICLIGSFVLCLLKLNEKALQKLYSFSLLPLAMISGFYVTKITKSKHHIYKVIKQLDEERDQQVSFLKLNRLKESRCNRDIYFIVLDEFVSPKMLTNYYKFNLDSFFDELSALGFKVVSHSYSNYPWTIPSISSMLSMNYHKNWVSKKEFPQIADHIIKNSLATQLLDQEGYQAHILPSIYWLGNPHKNIFSDFLLRSKSYGLILSSLKSTPLKKKARERQRKFHRAHILKQLQEVKDITKGHSENNKFIFAHFLCPHRPNVFDQNGQIIRKNEIISAEKDKNHRFYLNQLTFMAKELQKLVTDILNESPKKPIIVLISDHGKFPVGVSGKNKETLPMEQISWRFSNFIAVLDPDNKINVPEEQTAVNVLRSILNNYLGYPLEPLPNYCHTHFFNFEIKTKASEFICYQKNEYSQISDE